MLQPHQFGEVASRTMSAIRSQQGLFNGRAPVDRGMGTGRSPRDWRQGTGRNVDADATSDWVDKSMYLGGQT